MNILQAKNTIKRGYRINRPVLLLSSPGIGKSSAIFQCCTELGKEFDTPFGMIEVRGASSSPSELAAIKYVAKGEVQEAEQAWVPTEEKVKAGECSERGIIFCDEISDSMKAVQSTLQRLFLDRKLGGLTLAKGWYVAAAGNRAKDKAASGNLSRAFINRCITVTVLPDPDVLFDWGLVNEMDHRTLAFLRFRPDCINDGLEVRRTENQAFCSPRSLEIASDILKGDMVEPAPEAEMMEMMTGTLGDGVGSEFTGFVRIMDELPDLDKILADPENYPIPTATDVSYATIGALTNRAKPKNVQKIMKYFVRMGTELSVVAIKDLAKMEKSVFTTKEFISWSADNIKFAV